MLRGRPTLRTGDGSRELAESEAVHFPRGPDGAHGLANKTDKPVRLLTALDSRLAEGCGVPGPQADHHAGADGLADRRSPLADPRRRAARFTDAAVTVLCQVVE